MTARSAYVYNGSTWEEIGVAIGGTSIPAGGTAGQVLAKASASDADVTWIDPPATGLDPFLLMGA